MKIPATVITGFLGAGKTSLLRHVLENAGGRRIAVIINEFGGLGFDREMLLGCPVAGCGGDDVVELANGCICCTVADEFLPTMEMLLERPEPPDHIVIETSGLALPKPLVKAFNWPEVRSRVTVDGVIAVIDAPAVAAGRFMGRFAENPGAVQDEREADEALDHLAPLEEVFEDQILCADLVALNKVDLLDETALSSVRAVISGISPGGAKVKIVDSVHGAVDVRVVLGQGCAVEDHIEGRASRHDGGGDHNHDDFDSFVVHLEAISDPKELETRIRLATEAHDILRVKGFVHVTDKDMRHVVQGVGGRIQRYYDRPWRPDEERGGRLVVIGQKGLDRTAIQAALTSGSS